MSYYGSSDVDITPSGRPRGRDNTGSEIRKRLHTEANSVSQRENLILTRLLEKQLKTKRTRTMNAHLGATKARAKVKKRRCESRNCRA